MSNGHGRQAPMQNSFKTEPFIVPQLDVLFIAEIETSTTLRLWVADEAARYKPFQLCYFMITNGEEKPKKGSTAPLPAMKASFFYNDKDGEYPGWNMMSDKPCDNRALPGLRELLAQQGIYTDRYGKFTREAPKAPKGKKPALGKSVADTMAAQGTEIIDDF